MRSLTSLALATATIGVSCGIAAADKDAEPAPRPIFSKIESQKAIATGTQGIAIDRAAFDQIGDAVELRLEQVPLGQLKLADLELERITVLADDARRTVVGEAKRKEDATPPTRLWQGTVAGDPDSLVFLSDSAAGTFGWVDHDGEQYVLTTGDPLGDRQFVSYAQSGIANDLIEFNPWQCGNNHAGPPPPPDAGGHRVTDPGACFVVTLAIDTDNRFLSDNFGGSTSMAQAYIETLVGSANVVYKRDANLTFKLVHTRFWETSDPWTDVDTPTAGVEIDWKDVRLEEFAAEVNSNPADPMALTGIAMCLSAESLGGGVAMEIGGVCGPKRFAVCGGMSGYFPTPLSPDRQNWDPLVFMHELGHLLGAIHTHEMFPAADLCGLDTDGDGDAGPCPETRGTIMSYCHLCDGGTANIDFRFHPTNRGAMIAISTLRACIAAGDCGETGPEAPCDERTIPGCGLVDQYPWNTVGRLLTGRSATGFLVSPYTGLTSGEAVYDRNNDRYRSPSSRDPYFLPGACMGESDVVVTRFGSRDVRLVTNEKYADPDYDKPALVDYGAFHFACPFEGITTFPPLRFRVTPDRALMAGYPIEGLEDAVSGDLPGGQWWSNGDVLTVRSRLLAYEAASSPGATGSPVWERRGDVTDIVVHAINSEYGDLDCNDWGVRLSPHNRRTIRTWMRWRPSIAEQAAAGCPPIVEGTWADLVVHFESNPALLLEATEIRVETPIAPPPTGPTAHCMQYIEHGFYEWLEYDLQPGNPDSNRLVLLLEAPGRDLPGLEWMPGMPFDAEKQGWLTPDEAAILLSASAGRAIKELDAGEYVEVSVPMQDEFDPDLTAEWDPFAEDPGEDGPAEPAADCPGDFNGDGVIDGADMGLMLGAWGDADPKLDLDGSGAVDGGDLGMLLGFWGPCR